MEKHSWLRLYLKDVLKAAENPFFIMLVFGSYAQGTETRKSDLDLLFIVPKKEDILVLEKVSSPYTKVKKSLFVVSVSDFIEMIKNPKTLNIGNEAKKHHFIVYGAEPYYQLLAKT